MQSIRVPKPINPPSGSLKTVLRLLLGCGLFLSGDVLLAAPPDLTNGGVPGDTISFNMGSTGARGWSYHVRENTSESRQIQIKSVASGSPSAGILAAADVILGADGTGAEPVNFTSDARKSLADAINDAEARNPATLKLIRWRAGTTSTVTITLQTMGAYSATAPYNCPKSSLILQRGLQAIMASGSAGETAGSYSFGTVSLLAANNPTDPTNAARMTRAQTEARALVPSASVRAQMMSDTRDATSMITWERGHKLIVMAEYYLLTSDAQVLPGIEAYAVNIAKNSSLFGTMGHIFAEKNADGSNNGPMGGVYGPVNSAGMPCFLGMLLAKECGLTNPELASAIERMNRFFGYYAGRGSVPYGEHEAYWQGHESNGKSGLGALCFNLQTTRATEGRFFAKMAAAATSEREIGHTGAFFNYTWAPLGAASGGEDAAVSHFSRIRWMLDLNRRWDGKFDYDCLNGEGDNSGTQYGSFRMSTAALLTYALPLRQLRITGKNHDSNRFLTSTDVSEAVAADGYSAVARTISQLIADLGSWSPKVQRLAGEQLATRTIDTATLNQITALANDPLGTSRIGACIALGKISNSGTANARAATLAALLTDPQNHVRFMAAEGMRYLPDSAKLTQINAILSAAASTATPLQPFDEEDPLHFAHGRLAMLLFYSGNAYGPKGVIYGSKINSPTVINRTLLYPAIRAVAANPVGMSRSTLYQTYINLTAADVNALAGTIVDSVQFRAPSDKMFSGGVRKGGIETLEKYKRAEGVPLSMIYAIDHAPSNDGYTDGLPVLKKYAGGCTTVTPDPDVIGFCRSLLGGSNAAAAQAVLDAIAADPNPAPLTPFKSVQSTTADALSINLPANQTTLRVTGTDLAQGESVFTWRKVHGAGDVTFTPNGSAAAKDSVIQFNNVPGKYLLEATMSDQRGLTEVYGTVLVTLRNSDGSLPANSPPVANPQTVAAIPASVTPITLTGTDPEDYPLLFSVSSQPAHGSLTGTAPNLSYSADVAYLGADSFTFQIMDSEGQAASATVSINVTAAGIELNVHEGFDYPVGSNVLTPLNGGTGFTGAWSRAPEGPGDEITVYDATGLWDGVVTGFPTTPAGGPRYIGGAPGTADDRITAQRVLSQNAGAMAGADKVLWASVVWKMNGADYGRHVGFVLGTDGISNRSQNVSKTGGFGAGLGHAIGIGGAINSAAVSPVVFLSGNVAQRTTTGAASVSTSVDNIIVMKFVFADGAANDRVYAYRFFEGGQLTEAAFNTSAVFAESAINQDTLNILSFSQSRVGVEAIDEIRLGNSFAAVIGVAGTPPDTTPPALLSIADDRSGETMLQGQPVSYTFTFSEAMATASIGASDFNNAGTASISIPSVNQPLPNVVTVQVVPTTPGTLQLRIPQGAVLTDLAGLALDTTAALTDDTVITVNPAMVDVPFLLGLTLAQAESALSGSSLATGLVAYQYSGSVPANQVLAQNPSGGTSVSLGSSVALTVSLGPNLDKLFSAEDIAVSGTVTNSRIVTEASDDTYETIQEIEDPDTGDTSQRRSQLEHKWRFEVPAADSVTFHVEAYHTANTEGDDFLFAYSTTGVDGTYLDMLTVTKTSDDHATQSFTLPPGVSGTIHVRVLDTDRTLGQRALDTLHVDTLYFQTFNENGPVFVIVPDVVGQMQAAAQSAITSAGLVVGTVSSSYHATIPAGQVIGQNPSGGGNIAIGSSVDLVVSLGDTLPPSPATMTFAITPAATSISAITMTAITASDANGVQYQFLETSGNPGGTSSAWQDSPTYTDTGLNPNTPYTYTVQARDKSVNQNTNTASAPAFATTQAVPGGAVIYEPFGQAVGSALNGRAGGPGLGNWTLKDNTDDVIKSSSMSYGNLPVSGNQFNGQARYNNNAYPTLSAAGLMTHGATLWFSAVIQPQSVSNRRFVLALSTADIDPGTWTVGTTGQCIGFNLQNGQDLEIATASAGTISRNTAKADLSTAAPVLVVGQITWGAVETAADTINLYLPGTNLTKPAILDTSTVVVNQAAFDTLVIGYGGTGATRLDEIRFGATYEAVIGQGSSGPGPLDHFAISAIPSPQSVGTPITGITLTAQDAANQTVTGFTDTVTFGGTGGFSGTSASFVAGVLSGVSVTPTVAGSNLTLTVTDSVSGKTGSTTITTVQTPYETWSGGALFNEDSNGDGVDNGMAWVLGAKDKNTNALDLLPTFNNASDPDYFVFIYRRLDTAVSAGTGIAVCHGSDLGGWTTANHDGTNIITTTTNDFYGASPGIDKVEVKIKKTLAVGGRLFTRLEATP